MKDLTKAILSTTAYFFYFSQSFFFSFGYFCCGKFNEPDPVCG